MGRLGEQVLLPNEACNLGSINLLNHLTYVDEHNGYKVDYEHLRNTIKLAVRFMDDVIEINHYPIEDIDKMTRYTRKIGLGVMGFADALMKLGIRYGSDESISLAKNLMKFINNTGHEESINLANKRGAYPAFYDGAGILLTKERNATITTIAPTGTLSVIASVSSGIEPVFSLAYTRNAMNGTILTYVNDILREFLDLNFINSSAEYLIDLIIKNHGSTENITKLPEFDKSKLQLSNYAGLKKRTINELIAYMQEVFVGAHDIKARDHIRIQAAFQKYTDNAISKTINFPNSATKEDIYHAYMQAYKTGCKGITIYRDGCRDTQVLNSIGTEAKKEEKEDIISYPETFTELPIDIKEKYLHEIMTTTIVGDILCDGCKARAAMLKDIENDAHDMVAETVKSIIPRDRPEEVYGITRKIPIGCGNLYVTVNHDENGICEVFTNTGKAGGCPSQSEATARLVSIALRAGVDIDEIIHQLRGIRCPSCQRNSKVKVLSCPDAIGRMLEEAKKQIDATKELTTLHNDDFKIDMGIENDQVKIGGIDQIINEDNVGDDTCCSYEPNNEKRTAYEETLHRFYTDETLNMKSDDNKDPSALKFAKECPECGSPLEHEGGCVVCRECGWSKCG